MAKNIYTKLDTIYIGDIYWKLSPTQKLAIGIYNQNKSFFFSLYNLGSSKRVIAFILLYTLALISGPCFVIRETHFAIIYKI